jgi:hypothetical protein
LTINRLVEGIKGVSWPLGQPVSAAVPAALIYIKLLDMSFIDAST